MHIGHMIVSALIHGLIYGAIFKVFRHMPMGEAILVAGLGIGAIAMMIMSSGHHIILSSDDGITGLSDHRVIGAIGAPTATRAVAHRAEPQGLGPAGGHRYREGMPGLRRAQRPAPACALRAGSTALRAARDVALLGSAGVAGPGLAARPPWRFPLIARAWLKACEV